MDYFCCCLLCFKAKVAQGSSSAHLSSRGSPEEAAFGGVGHGRTLGQLLLAHFPLAQQDRARPMSCCPEAHSSDLMRMKLNYQDREMATKAIEEGFPGSLLLGQPSGSSLIFVLLVLFLVQKNQYSAHQRSKKRLYFTLREIIYIHKCMKWHGTSY